MAADERGTCDCSMVHLTNEDGIEGTTRFCFFLVQLGAHYMHASKQAAYLEGRYYIAHCS